MKYRKIKRNPQQFLSLTGLEIAEFEALSKEFEVDLNNYLSKFTFLGKERIRVYKPRGRELTDEQKHENRQISSFRVKVEHAIGRVKIFRIVKERFRCHKLFFNDLVFEIACGLHNFKLSCI